MKLKFLGIGDNVADYYKHINTIYPGGCAYNFSAFTTMLGGEAGYLGIFGDDFSGRHLIQTAKDLGINMDRCRVFHGESPRPAVVIENGERIFVGTNEGGVWERSLILNERDFKYIRHYDLIHTSLYSKMEQNLEILHDLEIPISMDFGTAYSESFYEKLCCHLTFAEMSCSSISVEEMIQRIYDTHAMGARYVLATRGAEGAWFFNGTDMFHSDAQMKVAQDTMGAGDSFITAFLKKFLETHEEQYALEAAAEFSAQVVMLDGSFGYGVKYVEDVIID